MVFAKAENNEIPSSGKELTEFAESFILIPGNGSTLFSHINILRKKLAKSFGISGDPIPHSEDAKSYTTLFRIKDSPYAEEYKESIQEGGNVKCDGCGKLIKNYTSDNRDDSGYNTCDTCLGKKVHRDESISGESTYADDTPDEWN